MTDNHSDKQNKMQKVFDQSSVISVVVPVFNEEAVLDEFYRRIKTVVDKMNSFRWEIIFVDDGSNDGSYRKMVAIADKDFRIKIIKFSRNFGHQIAITAGIEIAKGDAVVVIDADLQDPPETIGAFIDEWQKGCDVVYGIREQREGESRLKLMTASLFYRSLKRLTNVSIPVDVGDFRLMDRRVVGQFLRLKERDRFVRGLVSWLGYRQKGVYYHRDQRYAGETKYPLKKMLKFAIDGITSFSTMPLKLSTWLGYASSLIAFLYLCSVFIQKLMGITVPGFATIMVAMLFLGGVQLICLGIIGEYIGRIFNEMKHRPIYLIEEIYTKNPE